MRRYFSLHGVSTVAWLLLGSFGMTLVIAGDKSSEDAQRCNAAAVACTVGNEPALCSVYKKNLTSEGLFCPGVNAPALPATNAAPPYSSGVPGGAGARDKLQEIHALCAARIDTPLSIEIPCEKALISASQDPIFNARDPATQLYVIEADKLLQGVKTKRLAEIDARATLLRMLLDLESRHRPELAAIAARESAAASAAQQSSATIAAHQERENQRLAAEEAARQAEARAAQLQQNQAVAVCVAEAKERIAGADFAVRSQLLTAQSGYGMRLALNHQSGPPFIEASCMNDQYWYKTIPRPSRTLNCQSTGGGNATCREQ
jgi:hypothetical protein